jgi:hypothetical protein
VRRSPKPTFGFSPKSPFGADGRWPVVIYISPSRCPSPQFHAGETRTSTLNPPPGFLDEWFGGGALAEIKTCFDLGAQEILELAQNCRFCLKTRLLRMLFADTILWKMATRPPLKESERKIGKKKVKSKKFG